jgi:hypothetical protein
MECKGNTIIITNKKIAIISGEIDRGGRLGKEK